MENLEKELLLLEQHRNMLEDWIFDIKNLIKKDSIINLGKDYAAHVNRDTDFGFNLFNLISDQYKRENLHSDILRAFLDPKEKHNEGETYLHLFLKFINENSKEKLYINLSDYMNSSVIREHGKIDILILDAVSKKAIIIENKINGAKDTERQLPRYIEYVNGLDVIDIDAVVYLVLGDNDKISGPTRNGWKPGDEELVFGKSSKFVRVATYNERKNCLFNGWILSCQEKTSNEDAKAILRQYNKLIHQIGATNMNKVIMEKFLQSMMEGENYSTALSLKSMLDELDTFRSIKLMDTYTNNHAPFAEISFSDGVYFGKETIDRLALGIYIEENRYLLELWDKDYFFDNNNENLADATVKNLNYTSILKIDHAGSMVGMFKFPSEETQLYKFIDEFKGKLSAIDNPTFRRIN